MTHSRTHACTHMVQIIISLPMASTKVNAECHPISPASLIANQKIAKERPVQTGTVSAD